ncbi:MAG: hypothetical protein JST44_27440, partial [Cyanobacteria bacterium SZAS LIN-5]|nr:hypothetical protein [Cyanobacteria bacterium SZAS LIN-5]
MSKHQAARDSNEVPKPEIEKLANGQRISMWLKPEVCVLTSAELEHLLGKPLPEYDEKHTEYRGSKVYKVPAGLLVLVSREGGFNAIWLAQVYSADTVYPQPRQPIPFFSAEYLNDPFFRTSLARAGQNSLKVYAGLIEDTLKKDPTNVQALTYKAEIAAKQHDLEQAVTAINQAIKLQSAQSKNATQISADTGNQLLMDKGNYLLEQKKFAEALTIFEQAFPKEPEADQLYQRAKAEIGVGQYESARKDLSEAVDRYFFWGRISRRDEACKLLADISAKDLVKDHAAAEAVVTTQSEIIESERNKAKEFREQVNAAIRLKNEETLHRQQYLINERCKDVLIAMSKGANKPLKLTEALVDFARTATEMKQLPAARASLDRAIQAYCSYGPISEYDDCTVSLIKQLVIFPDAEIGERLRKVATRSEPFCDDGNFRENHDSAFKDLIMQYREDHQIALLRIMIDIRERQSKGPKNSSKIWQDRLKYVETECAKHPTNVLRPNSWSAREHRYTNRVIPGISENFDASLNAISEMERLIHQMDSTSERNTSLIADWKTFVLRLNCGPELKQMLRFAGCLAIANGYLQKSAPKLAADSIHEGVNNLLDTDLDCLTDSLAG